MKHNDLNFRQIEAVVDKLGGKKGIDDLLSGKTKVVKVTSFNVWKTIKIGIYKNVSVLRKALKKTFIKINEWGAKILSDPTFTVSLKEEEIQLMNVSPSELGFRNGATYSNIIAKAKKLGFELCPPEVGPQLRLQYLDQPKNEWLYIAMKPIVGSYGKLGIFGVGHGSESLCLCDNIVSSNYIWYARHRLIFCLPKHGRKNS